MNDIPDVTHVTEEITPARARKYLASNTRNRPVRAARVAQLAADMLAGRWQENGEAGVTFDSNGELAGGQHTLSAVAESGVTIRCRVTRGVHPQARSTMNDSARQKFADDLAVMGVGSATRAEALLRKVMTWEKAAERHGGQGGLGSWRQTRFTRAELAGAWPAYADGITEAARASWPWREEWPATGGNSGAMEFMFWLLLVREKCNAQTVTEFFRRLILGSTEEEDRILIKVRLKFRVSGQNDAAYQVYWMVRGWNAWVRGERLTKLQLPPGAGRSVPDPFPVIARAR